MLPAALNWVNDAYEIYDANAYTSIIQQHTAHTQRESNSLSIHNSHLSHVMPDDTFIIACKQTRARAHTTHIHTHTHARSTNIRHSNIFYKYEITYYIVVYSGLCAGIANDIRALSLHISCAFECWPYLGSVTMYVRASWHNRRTPTAAPPLWQRQRFQGK